MTFQEKSCFSFVFSPPMLGFRAEIWSNSPPWLLPCRPFRRLTDTEGVTVAIDETDVAWSSDEEPPGCGGLEDHPPTRNWLVGEK